MVVVSVKSPDSLNAGSKAPNDINNILKEKFDAKIEALILGKNIFGKLLYKLKFFGVMLKARLKKDIVVLQFPIIERNFIMKLASRERTIVLLHDIDGLRYNKEDFKKLEFSKLKLFKYMIVHNDSMKKYLEEQGIGEEFVSLEVFDYLCNGDVKIKRDIIKNIEDCTLVYAGNLTKEKSPFLHQLKKEKMRFRFNVYGTGTELENLKGIVDYKGKYPPDELPNILDGNLGVIWDGAYNDEDEENCLKNYTKYNNPHKLSLYIASGLPVVAWKKAAIAKFIKKYNIGYVVDNLYEINDIDFSDYEIKLKNVNELKKKVRNGYFTVNAVNEVINKINGKVL